MSSTLFKVSNVTKSFGGLIALAGVSFQVEKGQTFCIIGPNGSGKTTLFNIISGILSADSGSIVYDGKEISGLAPHRIAQSGIVRTFQSARLFSNMTILENCELPQFTGSRTSLFEAFLCLKRERKERQQVREKAERLLAAVGGGRLYSRRHDYPTTCSLGEQRMLEMVRVLALDPELVLMDEPTQGMNPVWISETLDLIEMEFKQRGKTIIFIEHKMSVVMQIADHVMVLNEGKKISEGAPALVREDPAVIEAYLGK